MSLQLTLLAVTPFLADWLGANPMRIPEILARAMGSRATPESATSLLEELAPGIRSTLEVLSETDRRELSSRIAEITAHLTGPSAVNLPKDVAAEIDGAPRLEVGRDWFKVNEIFSQMKGADSTMPDFLLKGREIGPDLGAGHARLVDSDMLEKAARELTGWLQPVPPLRDDIGDATLRHWQAEIERKGLLDLLSRLRDFCVEAVERGSRLLVWIG